MAALPFRKRAFGNCVVVVVVVWIAGVVMQCPNGIRRDTLFQFFHFQSYLVIHRFFMFVVLPAFSIRINEPAGALRYGS